MNFQFNKSNYKFSTWAPSTGRVFKTCFGFDTETTKIDKAHPWLVPAYVIGAAFDGNRGYFVQRADVAAFFEAHRGVDVVFHNAAFDLSVINVVTPTLGSKLDIYNWADQDKIWDTQILHRLYMLAAQGHVASRKGESSLRRCALKYVGVKLAKGVVDSRGKKVRLSYGQFLGQPFEKFEPVYLTYLAQDVVATFEVFKKVRQLIQKRLDRRQKVWGFVSPEWLDEQVQRWGPLTHNIQLKASIVLRAITANGLRLDENRREQLAILLKRQLVGQRVRLRKFGFLPGQKGCQKALQGIFARLERQHAEVDFPRTPSGMYGTSRNALHDLIGECPFARLLLEYRDTQKLLSSFVGKMEKGVLHPSFNVLARSGRTSSFGEINAQNLPKNDQVRSCIIPTPGHVFIDLDYVMLELAVLAQICIQQFDLDSQMAVAINKGMDLHRLIASQMTGKPLSEITRAERDRAKAVNFGRPGGMGNATLRQTAKISYGVTMNEEEVEALSNVYFETFPEMREFLKDTIDAGERIAKLLELTPVAHFEHTDDRRFLNHPENVGRENKPHKILGNMLLKVVRVPNPLTGTGRPYSNADLDFFWSRAETLIDRLPSLAQDQLRRRRPSQALWKAVSALVTNGPVFTVTGRLRANASWAARHNTTFQGTAADGAKIALWRLWRSGFRIANFIHDEVLVEIPKNANLTKQAKEIRRIMVESMREIVTDVKIEVGFAAMDRWYKKAEAVYDKRGKLLLWHPQPEKAVKKV